MTDYEKLWGEPEGEEAPDYFQTSGTGFYPNLVWFNGHKVFELDPETGTALKQRGATVKALGFYLEADRLQEDLIAVLRKLAATKKARRCLIQHSDGKRKLYYKLEGSRFYILSHGTLTSREASRQLGVAAGVITRVFEKTGEQNTSTFYGALVIAQDLYEGGYIDEDGLPKPLVMRCKALVGNDLKAVFKGHADYIKHLREHGVHQRKAQYWAYAALIGPADEMVTHGFGEKSTEVFPIAFLNADRNTWGDAETLFAGEELYPKLFRLVFDTSGTRPIPGGIAVAWCQNEVKRALENQAQFNPEGKMPFGTTKIPDWHIVQQKAREASIFNQAAVSSNGAHAVDNSEEDRLRELLRKHAVQADLSEDEQWLHLVHQAGTALDTGNTKNATALIAQAGRRRRELQEATPDNGGF